MLKNIRIHHFTTNLMGFQSFEEIIAWKKTQDLAVLVYNYFEESRDWSFKDQICKASVSISNNIAEGYERRSSNEFKRFLLIAKGSCAEVSSMAHLAIRLGKIDDTQRDILLDHCDQISRMLFSLIRTIQSRDDKPLTFPVTRSS